MEFIPLDAIGRRPRKKAKRKTDARPPMPRDLRFAMADCLAKLAHQIARKGSRNA